VGLSQSAHKADGGVPWRYSLRLKLYVHTVDGPMFSVGVPAQKRLRGGNPSGGPLRRDVWPSGVVQNFPKSAHSRVIGPRDQRLEGWASRGLYREARMDQATTPCLHGIMCGETHDGPGAFMDACWGDDSTQ
jgi:hypothetical protein